MSLEEELYWERRRKWRRSAFWRGVLVTVAILVGLGVLGAVLGPERARGPHVAEVRVAGVILDDPARDRLLAEIAEDADARALVLRIDSPGGTVVGSEALYLALRRVAEEKPVVAVMGEVAASGGYVAAIAAEHIVARQNTLTGSIGVILEYPEISGLLDDLGVEVVTIRSSDVKGGASPLRELSPAERAAQERIVADANAWFRELVAERRGFSAAAIEEVADGSAFTGRMAVENGLIDAIGGVREARDYLAEIDSTLADLPLRARAVERDDEDLLDRLIGRAEALSGLERGFGPRLSAILR